ncbi:MAG: hypothetical protein ACLGGY_08320, partial [Gammaproteobacteria bacterium]
MTRQIFVTARPQPIPRWLEAFPDALLLSDPGEHIDPAPLVEAAVIWLHVAGNHHAAAASVRAIRAAAPHAPVVVLSN